MYVLKNDHSHSHIFRQKSFKFPNYPFNCKRYIRDYILSSIHTQNYLPIAINDFFPHENTLRIFQSQTVRLSIQCHYLRTYFLLNSTYGSPSSKSHQATILFPSYLRCNILWCTTKCSCCLSEWNIYFT